jgi:putative colanic acid biosynthesis UDP-glucose lipid carrier transferase
MITAREPRFRLMHPGATTMLHMAVDPVVAVAALAVSALWFDVELDRAYAVLALLVFSLVFTRSGRADDSLSAHELAVLLATRWATTVALLWLLGWGLSTLELFDRRVITLWIVATPLLQFMAHRSWPSLFPRLLARAGAHKVAIIAGANELGRLFADRIEANPCLGLRVAGFFDDRSPGRLPRFAPGEVLGSLEQLAEYVKRHRVDVIYSTLPMLPQPRLFGLLESLRDTTASIYFVPDVLRFDLIQARLDTVDGMPVIAVCESPCYGVNALLKRASDVALSASILLLTAPVLLAIALAVKMTSQGSILFKQRRYGLDGREIVVYKFRTMTCTEDGDVVVQATRDDPRATSIGAFLRRYSLDELPQFVNVLQGRMSLVGPRPHAVAHNEAYRKLIRGYMIRHKVKPGITGLAQVRGLRGETDTLDKMRARIECDLEYLRNWSLWLDLKIVLRTVDVVLRRTGAF